MNQVEIINEKEHDLTRIVFSGKITAAVILAALKKFYAFDVTQKILWDFSNCDPSALMAEDLTAFVETAKEYADLRMKGKSALVGNSDLQYGLGRMYSTLAEILKHPIPTPIFRTVDEALAWLDS